MRISTSIFVLSLVTAAHGSSHQLEEDQQQQQQNTNLRRKTYALENTTTAIESSQPSTRRVFIKYRHGQRRSFQTDLAKRSSSLYTKMHYDFDQMDTFVMTMTEDDIKSMKQNKFIESIHEDVKRYPQYIEDSIKPRQLLENSQTIPYGINMVQAPEVWKLGYKGQGVKVCVVDTGIDRTHEDFVNLDGTDVGTLDWGTDGVGHGTHCSGTIAAADNDFGVVGVAPEAEIFTIKVFGDNGGFAYSSGILAAAKECGDNGADIISMSLGGPLPNPFELLGFRTLLRNDVITVAAAGNFGNGLWSFPASYPGVISVGAIDKNKNLAPFSQYNRQVDLTAPGVNVTSTFPMAGSCSICETRGYKYGDISGTSMACPHVAGALALLKSFKPDATGRELVEALEETAEDLGTSGRDNRFGHGLIQTYAAAQYLNGGSLLDTIMEEPLSVNTRSCSGSDMPFQLKMLTDDYALETSWELRRISDGGIQLSGAGYDNNDSVSVDRCIPRDCYTLTVFDTEGDGMCCGYGIGGYSATVDGTVVMNKGGDFQNEDVTTFGVCSKSRDAKPAPSEYN
eukprot:CAMPEP_0202456616 /NCGR_PEP_ID=MMETSP1360-20130828/13828_1 /ASSEMBLY_ACC=CAM_ASM_000848 /TAXON_ID=515479 /ORGANISM="Licmophora paradoxa, Strain CCMP2313" /LENGTH=566 /DNA_ID=CAMNT_0049076473 /DNA_START=170 /DNA_END=1870 /DNA_ORIENTATION=-